MLFESIENRINARVKVGNYHQFEDLSIENCRTGKNFKISGYPQAGKN